MNTQLATLTEHPLISPNVHVKGDSPFWKVYFDDSQVTVFNVAPDGYTGVSFSSFHSARNPLEKQLAEAIARAEEWNAEGLTREQASERMKAVSEAINARCEASRAALTALSDRIHAESPHKKFPHIFRAHPSIFGLDESDLEDE